MFLKYIISYMNYMYFDERGNVFLFYFVHIILFYFFNFKLELNRFFSSSQ